jgi:hypothetical protein
MRILLALILAALPTLAQAQASLNPRFNSVTANSVTATSPSGCATTAGAFATDGTLSWQPSCWGVWSSPSQAFLIYPTRGAAKDASGNPSSNVMTGSLIQAQGNGANAVQANGQFINLDVVGGPYSAAHAPDGSVNTTGQLISVRQRPDASGNRPAYTWGQNIDLHVAPGSGSVQSYGVEYDVNNFNMDAAAGSGAIAAHIFLNGIAAYPGTAYIYGGAGFTQGFSGTVTTSGTTVARVSGNSFTAAITRVTINGTTYRVNYVDANTLTITDAPPANITTAVAYSANSAMVHDGVLFSGDNLISDNDIHLGTAAYSALRVDGKHNIVLNATGDTAPYAATLRAGQVIAFSGFGKTLTYDSGKAGLSYNGGAVRLGDSGAITGNSLSASGTGAVSFGNSNGVGLTVNDAGGAVANNLAVLPATAGFGPSIKAVGSDTNVPLNLQAQGASPVQVLSGLNVTGGGTFSQTVAAPSLKAAANGSLTLGNLTNGTGLYIADPGTASANYVYVQAAGAGFGPAIKAAGSDTNVPLNLYGQGASPVQVQGGFTVSNGATITGITTFKGRTQYTNATIAAAGTTQAGATLLSNDISVVTSGTGGVLLYSLVGQRQEVFNRSGTTINVYPMTGAQIESAGTNNPITLANGGHAVFVCTSSTQCYQAP